MGRRALDWLKQAENDLLWAQDTRNAGRWGQACFIAQQIGEKAMKAIAYARGADIVKSHSIVEIAKSIDVNGDIEAMGRRLDLYYISTRYPDAVPSGAPYEYFDREQATVAFEYAEKLLALARTELSNAG